MISDYNTLLPNISTEFAHASTCNDYIFQEILHTHFFGYSRNLNDFYTFLHSFGPLKDSNPFYIEHFTLGSLKTTLRNLDQSIIRKKKIHRILVCIFVFSTHQKSTWNWTWYRASMKMFFFFTTKLDWIVQ